MPANLRDYKRLAIAVVMLLFVAELAFGQGIVTGSISGTVLDPQGAVVAGAEVRATHTETNRTFSTTSTAGGVIQLASLPPGTYKVTISAQGFSQYSAQNVVVVVGKDSALGGIRLSIGSTREAAQVEE